LHREIELMRGIHSLQPVVIVDEAHLLDKEMLEEVRFLLNFKMDSQNPMALILVGQSELRERFKLQAYAGQRIDLVCRMPHMDRAQTGEYVKQHLAYSGVEHDIFSDSALDEIFVYDPLFSGSTVKLGTAGNRAQSLKNNLTAGFSRPYPFVTRDIKTTHSTCFERRKASKRKHLICFLIITIKTVFDREVFNLCKNPGITGGY